MKIPPIPLDATQTRKITPTDVTQFIRHAQCERFLRLQLHQRNEDYDFLYQNGVQPQPIPPLLSTAGSEFESALERVLPENQRFKFESETTGGQRRREANNQSVVEKARELKNGETLWLLQPRLEAIVGAWSLRGDADLLRLQRTDSGVLHIVIADMKSTSVPKIEHRLQVAFYYEMLSPILRAAGIEHAPFELGIVYRGPLDRGTHLDSEAQNKLAYDHEAVLNLGLATGFYERIENIAPYLREVRELVTSEDSTAQRIAESPYENLQWHLEAKCDGCTFNQWCLTSAAQEDDLSLLPHLGGDTKIALHNHGIRTVGALAALKSLRPKDAGEQSSGSWSELETNAGQEALVRTLAATRGLGHRVDELIHRALRYCDWRNRQRGLEGVKAWWDLPSKGYGTLPFCGPNHNSNLVKIFIDTQFDYLNERLYGLSALVVAYENGAVKERRSIVEMTDGPPRSDEIEARAVTDWIDAILRGVVELAEEDENGEAKAPIHLIFFNQSEQTMLLECLGRHFESITAATPLFDFVTQIAALDGAMVTFLESEMRELKNYPRTCASLHEISGLLGFDWSEPLPFRSLFRKGIFDGWKIEEEGATRSWVQNRARFSSHYPMEYVYAAWNKLPQVLAGKEDDFREFRGVTSNDWRAFQARRLEAMECIANNFKGNRQTEKTAFSLPDLEHWQGKAKTLADALDEFLTIEHHAELGAWKHQRLAPPERRALAGHTLVCKYLQSDQTPETLEKKAHNERMEREKALWKAENLGKRAPNGKFSVDNELTFRLRLDATRVGVSVDELLALTTLRAGDTVVIAPRWDVDGREGADQTPYTPTPKAMLYNTRADIISIERDGETCFIDVQIKPQMKGSSGRNFVFAGFLDKFKFEDGAVCSLDPSPDSWPGDQSMCAIKGALEGEPNALLSRFNAPAEADFSWSPDAARAQQRFLDGLNALAQSDANFKFEDGKQNFIGANGDAPYILVQGPPGTGKSYATSWALLARVQGALVAQRELRVLICCKTHAAIDVLLRNLRDCRNELAKIAREQPALFAQYFEADLMEVPLFRFRGKAAEEGIEVLSDNRGRAERGNGQERAEKIILAAPICIVGMTPGGVYRLCKDKDKRIFGNQWFDALVIDEASQMNLPEAMLGALAMKPDFALIVVGDPRQMPPIVKHDWEKETRRTFQSFRVFESLYDAIDKLDTEGDATIVRIKFQQSFRLHRDMAKFLHREIYAQDGIRFFSERSQVLAALEYDDPFVAAALNSAHALTVIVHDEANSVLENGTEAQLIEPILAALASLEKHGLDANQGLGIVVPHRAQRALLRDERWNVDTVERFQGDERRAMVFSATESARAHLSQKGGFLYDPRRLNVALSRAKQKMILVASRTVFSGFFADEDTFHNAQLWKNLLENTCNQSLWKGEREIAGKTVHVQVWGNDLNLPDAVG